MKLIDRLPFADRPHLITVGGEAVDVYRNQIIVWISIGDVRGRCPRSWTPGTGITSRSGKDSSRDGPVPH